MSSPLDATKDGCLIRSSVSLFRSSVSLFCSVFLPSNLLLLLVLVDFCYWTSLSDFLCSTKIFSEKWKVHFKFSVSICFEEKLRRKMEKLNIDVVWFILFLCTHSLKNIICFKIWTPTQLAKPSFLGVNRCPFHLFPWWFGGGGCRLPLL